ncbi:CHAT domain-containing protein, partial [Spirulina sp. CS-785/01]|uniref:CHAT domain-containing protein n=1 Tax=Spirulina sp. CS-785/01 TaxID=3021716 RepID=UPI0023310E95
VYTRTAFPEQWAKTQNNLANAYLYRIRGERAENLEQAIAAYDAALEVRTRTAFPEQWAMTQNNLGNAYRNRIRGERAENLERAIAAYDAALEVRTRTAFPEQWAETQNNLAIAYSDRIRGERAENLEQAIAALEAALEVYTPTAFPEQWAMTQNNLAIAYRERIRGERAENLERAIAAYEAALEVRTRTAFPQDWATTQNNLAAAYLYRIRGERAENLEQAIKLYQEALQIRTRTAFPQEHTETLNNLGFTYQAQSQHYTSNPENKQTALENAYNTFEQALDVVEYLRGEITSGDEVKRKLNEEWNRLYRGMVEVCLELQNYTAAIEYTDRSKARNLVELIATRDAYSQGEIPPEIRQRLQQLSEEIDQENRRLQQDPDPDYSHIEQLRQEFQAKSPYKPLPFQQMQDLLDEETAILEWYIMPDKFLVFTLTRQALKHWTSSEEDLDRLIDWGNDYLRDYRTDKTQWQNCLPQRLETLSQLLHLPEILDNLFKQFPTCKKLILIPHRYLHLFPLHALPIPVQPVEDSIRPIPPNTPTPEGASIAPLQDIFENGVSYAPNCQLLQQAQKRQYPDFKNLLAIQNPTDDLIGADLEIENIRTLFPQRSSLQKGNATKTNFLKKDFTQTHHLYFSCHAAFNPDSPFDSGLRLADDILTLETIIASLNLSQCSLVTLSACETGQVALDDTDEYISLSSGFILAGSPSVLVSQWSVNQISTALLLIKTYELLQQHPGKLAIALKAAQTWLRETTVTGFHQWSQTSPLLTDHWRKQLQTFFQQMGDNEQEGWNNQPYQSPYHWAAFCIVGQGEQKMASDADKIQAFITLIQENPDNIFADHWQSLNDLQSQLGDDDEKNAAALEKWLEERSLLQQAYNEKLNAASPDNPLLGATGEKGIGGSKAKPNTPSPSLPELIENISKKNTPPPSSHQQNPNQS